MKENKFIKKTLQKTLLIIIVVFLAFAPCDISYASGKAGQTGSTKSLQNSGKSGKKAKNAKNAKNLKASKKNKKGKVVKHSKKVSLGKGKGRKHRRRRGRARYVSSAESIAQKKKNAEITEMLKANPDLSGDVAELPPDSYVWPIRYGYISRGVRRGHAGVDMMSRAGEPIYAVADGEVTFVSVNNPKYRGYGKTCVISHPDKETTSLYSHCGAIYVQVGQIVQRGQKIAVVGRTGRTTANHLHFEMRKDGRLLNPEHILPKIGALGHTYVPH